MAQYVITNRQEDVNFEIVNDGVSRIIQNAKNLLMTQMGEIPYDRLRGFDPAIYHLPINDLRQALLPELDRVMMWEPGAEVVSATAEPDDENEVLITCVIEVGAAW